MGRLGVKVRVLAQTLLNRAGYRIERLIQPTRPIDVFDLAVRKQVSERGNQFFFVQIGAHDGSTLDPIRRYVTEYHWAGLLLEPQPAVFEQLLKNYAGETQLRFVNAAVARTNGMASLYTVPTDGPPTVVQGMASFDKQLLVKQIRSGTPIVELTVPTITLDALFREHDVRFLDLLQIDTEGFDYEVIKMVDFTAVRPGIIHYEHIHLSGADREGCERFLASHGYRLHCSGQDTTAIIQA